MHTPTNEELLGCALRLVILVLGCVVAYFGGRLLSGGQF